MADGVFHDRLQQKVWHQRVERFRRDFQAHRQPVAETGLLDFQVTAQKIQFLPQRHFLGVGDLQRVTQQITETRDHLVRQVGIFVHQRGNRVKRVEQKVRIELQLKGLQPGLRQTLLQFRGAEFALLHLAVIIERVADAHDHPIDEQIEMKRLKEQRTECFGKRNRRAAPAALHLPDPGPQRHVTERANRAGRQMDRHVAAPFHVVETKPPRQLNDRQRHHRPHVPIPQRPTHGLPPGDRTPRFVAGEIKLAGEGESNERPEQKDQRPSQWTISDKNAARHGRHFCRNLKNGTGLNLSQDKTQ